MVWLFAAGSGWQVLLADGDTGWHIRTGEYILAHGAVPHADPFSFTRPGAPWCAWEWLADVLFALAHRAAGLRGVVFLAGVVIAGFLIVLFRHMLARGAGFFLSLAATLLASGASGIHFLARPHIFTLLLLAISLWVVGRDLGAPSRAVWLLAPLTTLWANLHAGFVALPVSIAALAVAAPFERRWDRARRYGALAAACAAASLANPYGLGLHRHILEYLRSDWIRQAVDEFQSPRFHTESSAHFEILLFAGLMAAASLLGRRRIAEAVLMVGWAHAALVSVRNVPVFAVVASPILAAEASRRWNAWVAGRPARSVAAILDRIGAGFAASARSTSVWPAVFLVVLAVAPGHWPRDFPENKFPVGLIARHERELAGARVFTSDQWGDYLLYRFGPRQRVFIDGRSDFYGPEIGDLYLRTAYARGDWRAALKRYGIVWVLAPEDWPLTDRLSEGGWRLVEAGAGAALFHSPDGPSPPAAKENGPKSRNTLQGSKGPSRWADLRPCWQMGRARWRGVPRSRRRVARSEAAARARGQTRRG